MSGITVDETPVFVIQHIQTKQKQNIIWQTSKEKITDSSEGMAGETIFDQA